MVQSVADTISLVIVAGIEEAIKRKQTENGKNRDPDIVGPEDIDFGVDFVDDSPRQQNDINFESARDGKAPE